MRACYILPLVLAAALPVKAHAQIPVIRPSVDRNDLVVQAQGVRASRPLPGYACMMLSSPDASPPVLQTPSATAPRIGIASYTVIAADPVQAMNGYIRVLHLDGRQGWIDARQVRPWRSASDPSATCTPSLMSDGRPGFR